MFIIIIAKKYIAYQNNIWESLEELAQLFKLTENYDESLNYYDKSLKYFKQFSKIKQNIHSKSTIQNRLLNKQSVVVKILNEQKNVTLITNRTIARNKIKITFFSRHR